MNPEMIVAVLNVAAEETQGCVTGTGSGSYILSMPGVPAVEVQSHPSGWAIVRGLGTEHTHLVRDMNALNNWLVSAYKLSLHAPVRLDG